MSTSNAVLGLTLLLVLGAAGCQSPDDGVDPAVVEELQAELAARAQAEADLLERVESLETQVDRVTNDRSATQQLRELDSQLSALSETVASMDERFTTEGEARQAVADEAEAAAADLRSTLADLQGRVDQLQGETDELRTLYQTLRERVDRMQQG